MDKINLLEMAREPDIPLDENDFAVKPLDQTDMEHSLTDDAVLSAIPTGRAAAPTMSIDEAAFAVEMLDQEHSALEQGPSFTPPQPSDFERLQDSLPPNDLQTVAKFGYPADTSLQPQIFGGLTEQQLRRELRGMLEELD